MDQTKIKEIIKSLKKDYNLTNKGDLNEYLGIKIETTSNRSRVLTKPLLMYGKAPIVLDEFLEKYGSTVNEHLQPVPYFGLAFYIYVVISYFSKILNGCQLQQSQFKILPFS